jgi:hypothetical protein
MSTVCLNENRVIRLSDRGLFQLEGLFRLANRPTLVGLGLQEVSLLADFFIVSNSHHEQGSTKTRTVSTTRSCLSDHQ